MVLEYELQVRAETRIKRLVVKIVQKVVKADNVVNAVTKKA